MYLAIVLCSLPLGHVTELTARLPSALAGARLRASVLLVLRPAPRAARRPGGRPDPADGVHVARQGHRRRDRHAANRLGDGVASCSSSAPSRTTTAEARATSAAGAPDFGWWLAACLCMAGGVLTKWTAPQFFYGTAIPYLWWRPPAPAAGAGRTWSAPASPPASCSPGSPPPPSRGRLGSLLRHRRSGRAYRACCPATTPAALLRGSRRSCIPFKILLNTLPWSALALLRCGPASAASGIERGRRPARRAALLGLAAGAVLEPGRPSTRRGTASRCFPASPAWRSMVWHRLARRAGCPGACRAAAPARLLARPSAPWLAIKVVYVEAVVPQRSRDRQTAQQGRRARRPGARAIATCTCFRCKDEGSCSTAAARRPRPTRRPPAASAGLSAS